MKKIFLTAFLPACFLSCVASLAFMQVASAQEQITVTTYYPAPYGVYRELRVDQMSVGSPYRSDALSDGLLIVQSRIGVGTNNPATALEVVSSNDFPLRLNKTGSGQNRIEFSYGASRQWYTGIDGDSNFKIGTDVGNGIHLAANVGIGGAPGTGANTLNVWGKISTSFPGNGSQSIFQFDVAEDILAENVEPGDVVVIDPKNDQRVIKSTKQFDTTVAGIVSTDPAFHIGKQDKAEYLPLALAGRVLCKVTTENGPIQRGDLLTTSSKPGYAMKVTDRSKAVGAIVGKALQPLEKGDGKIMVLVTLQ